LIKEYQAIYGHLDYYINIFSRDKTSYTVKDALDKIDTSIKRLSIHSDEHKEIALFDSSASILEVLVRVGFLGIKSNTLTKYTFTHDGSDSEKTFSENDDIMVHPCFWRALEIKDEFSRDVLEDIQDEYDVEIVSDELSIRKRDIGRHITSVNQIEHGQKDASKFEEWCKSALVKCFSNGLTNFDLHPNKIATLRRDVVAAYNSADNVWRRIHSDYGCRQVIFEIKNYKDVTNDDYRQFWSYLTTDGPYGKLMFYICRDDKNEPTPHEISWMREGYNSQGRKVCIKLTDKFLCAILSKLRSPQKIDHPDLMMKKLIDTYERQYLR
jgi:hypothetical protein